ncbi:MAG: hypothetical protein MPK08_02055, partial [Alphaproteobacteria bacterium]|nr:hypothetical protein [Alphaproteobacteria bacterium]MDA8003671.1 hypothetical protein [Alphaproteobacteria bacterium]MDA8013272.1 hypothetical protein [Alphaproteobacteria bacterium]
MKQQTATPRIYFLRAAPAGVSGCSQQERLSRPVQSPLSLVEKSAPTGLFMVRHLALVSTAFRLLKSRLKRAMPTDARGRCPQKIKICLLLIKGQTAITGSINQPLALVGEGFRLLKSPLKRTAPADARGRRPQKIKFVPLIKGTDDDHGDRSIGAMPLALAGEGFRLLKSPLKRTAPAD